MKNKLNNNDNKKIVIKPEIKNILIGSNYDINLDQSKKSPRELAIVFQTELKKLKEKIVK